MAGILQQKMCHVKSCKRFKNLKKGFSLWKVFTASSLIARLTISLLLVDMLPHPTTFFASKRKYCQKHEPIRELCREFHPQSCCYT